MSEPRTRTGRKVVAIHGDVLLDDVLGIEAEATSGGVTTEGLDVERLAKAIRAWWTGDSVTGDAALDAEEIATEYAALSTTPPAPEEHPK